MKAIDKYKNRVSITKIDLLNIIAKTIIFYSAAHCSQQSLLTISPFGMLYNKMPAFKRVLVHVNLDRLCFHMISNNNIFENVEQFRLWYNTTHFSAKFLRLHVNCIFSRLHRCTIIKAPSSYILLTWMHELSFRLEFGNVGSYLSAGSEKLS